MNDFKFKLADIRKSKNLKQSDLAQILDVKQQRISEYERGLVLPSVERLIELAQILDVSLDDLIEFKRIHKEYSNKLNNTTSNSTIK